MSGHEFKFDSYHEVAGCFKKRYDIVMFVTLVSVRTWVETETRAGETKPKKGEEDRTNRDEETGS